MDLLFRMCLYYGRSAQQMRTLYFCPVISIYLSSSFFYFSSPNLSGRRLDVYYISTHASGLSANLECRSPTLHAAHWKYKTQKIAIWAPSHNFVGLYLRNVGMYRQSEKNWLHSDTSSTCSDNMVYFGTRTSEIISGVRGTLVNFNRFRVLHRYCTAL